SRDDHFQRRRPPHLLHRQLGAQLAPPVGRRRLDAVPFLNRLLLPPIYIRRGRKQEEGLRPPPRRGVRQRRGELRGAFGIHLPGELRVAVRGTAQRDRRQVNHRVQRLCDARAQRNVVR